MGTRCLSTRLIAFLAAVAGQVVANFASGCSEWYIHGRGILTIECQTWDPNQGRIFADLDLDACIGVDSTANTMVWMD